MSQPCDDRQDDLFRPLLEEIINLRHPLVRLAGEIDWAASRHSGKQVRKVFLADGDALVAKASFLLRILEKLAESFPNLRRVSCYASPQSMQVRSVEEMSRLREMRSDRIVAWNFAMMGVEASWSSFLILVTTLKPSRSGRSAWALLSR